MKKILNYFVRRVDFIVLLSDDENKLLCLVLSAYWLVHVNASVKWNTTRVSFCFLFVFFLFFFFCSFVSLGLPPSHPSNLPFFPAFWFFLWPETTTSVTPVLDLALESMWFQRCRAAGKADRIVLYEQGRENEEQTRFPGGKK